MGSALEIRRKDRTREWVIEPDSAFWRMLDILLDAVGTIDARAREIGPRPLKLQVTIFPQVAQVELAWTSKEEIRPKGR